MGVKGKRQDQDKPEMCAVPSYLNDSSIFSAVTMGDKATKFVVNNYISPAGVSVSDSDEEPVSKHPRLSGDISDQLTDDTGSYFEVLAQHTALSGEDDLEDLSVMDTSPPSALQTDDDIMVGTTGAVCVGGPGRKTSDVNDNYNTSTSANTVTPLWEDGSRFNKSNRPARNYGIFYFPHKDTDSEQDGLKKALAPQKLGPVVAIESSDEDDAWTYKGGTDENTRKQPLLSGSSVYISTTAELKTLSGDSKKRSRQNELAKTLSVNDTNNITEIRGSIKESDVSSALTEEPEVLMTEGAPREGRKKMFAATHESKDCVTGDRSEESQQNCKVTTRELVNQVVKMTVRDFEPLVFTQTQAKQSRVKNWIKTNSHTFMRPQDSCDASGEYTTGDSDDDKVSDSSEDQNGSVATCKHQIGHGLDSRSCSTEVFQDPDATPVNEKTLPVLATPSPEHGKVIMRCRRRLATGEQRPWSVSGLSQLGLTGSDGALANFSISESALHQILATSATPTASSPQGLLEEGSGSRTGSLRRRKVRTRRRNTGRKSESGGSGGGSGGSDTQNKSSNNLAASNRTLTKSVSRGGRKRDFPGNLSQNGRKRDFPGNVSHGGRKGDFPGNVSRGGRKRDFPGNVSRGGRKRDCPGNVSRGGMERGFSRQRESRWEEKGFSRQRESRWEEKEFSRQHESRWKEKGLSRQLGNSSRTAQRTRTVARPVQVRRKEGQTEQRGTTSCSFSGGSPPSASEPAAQTVSSTEEEDQTTPVVTPQFRLGAKVTPVNPLRVREGSVGVNEEQLSSFSEQAWDNYQEKYMSEPNSEELADSEAARRLLEIDDDYRNFLDSQSDCMSSSVSTNQPRTVSPVRRRRQGALPLVDISVLDSDSDVEDVRDFIQQSQFNLMFSENVFAKQLTKTSVDLNDFVQIAATCRDNVNVLHYLLGPKGEGDLLSSQYCREIRERERERERERASESEREEVSGRSQDSAVGSNPIV
uniref:Uncharacterized protein n=1 Tax=Timema douglasi TaxID=61478 RepID=A0A7R8VT72_TIMDO|nr:unnamed protein product [Timema douglasi]